MKHCASFLILFMPLIAFATGCETGTPTGKVTGEVTYNGEPIPNGTVVFEVSGARPATAKIDQGQLVDMETGKPGIDVPVGTAKIAVFATEVAPESEEAETSPADPGGGGVDNRSNYMGMGAASLIPPHYNDPASSGLTAEIQKGENTVPLELKDQ